MRDALPTTGILTLKREGGALCGREEPLKRTEQRAIKGWVVTPARRGTQDGAHLCAHLNTIRGVMYGSGTKPVCTRSTVISYDGQSFMKTSLAGRALLGLGVVVGMGATAAWLVGYDPSTLPPALLRIAAYKLTALAALGLMTAGAVVLRFGRQAERQRTAPLAHNDPAYLNAGDGGSIPNHAKREHSSSAPDPVAERRL